MLKIIIDNREKTPWTFQMFKSTVPFKLEAKRNETADYTIEKGTDFIAIERKSFVDFVNTLGLFDDGNGNRKRDRFEKELQRMESNVTNSYVIVECPLSKILNARSGWQGQLQKILLLRAVVRFRKRYRKIKWIFCNDRRDAEKTAFYLLASAYKLLQARDKT